MAAITKPDGGIRPLHDGTHSVRVNNDIIYRDRIQCPGPPEVAAIVRECSESGEAPFGCHFWTPFWGSNSGTIFGSIFQPPFWGPKMVQNLQKFLLSKLHSKTFPASKHAYQNASVVIPS